MNKLVTVIIPSYNHSLFIIQTIQSVIDQDYKNIELIIIDDGSNDNSVEKIEIIQKSCHDRFTNFILKSRPNRGLCATLNEAIHLAKGEYISIIASDDFMYPDKTSLQVKYLENHPACSGVFSGASIINSKGQLIANRSGTEKKYLFKDIILNNYQLFSPSAMYRSKELISIGGYNENVLLEDWFMNLSITETHGYLFALEKVLIAYRRHERNASNNSEKLHVDRANILQLFKHSKYYKDAQAALLYTIGYESVSVNKLKTITCLMKVAIYKPSILMRKRTLITIIKLFIPKVVLRKKTHGR